MIARIYLLYSRQHHGSPAGGKGLASFSPSLHHPHHQDGQNDMSSHHNSSAASLPAAACPAPPFSSSLASLQQQPVTATHGYQLAAATSNKFDFSNSLPGQEEVKDVIVEIEKHCKIMGK